MSSGTGSGRACLVDAKGKLIAEHSGELIDHLPPPVRPSVVGNSDVISP